MDSIFKNIKGRGGSIVLVACQRKSNTSKTKFHSILYYFGTK